MTVHTYQDYPKYKQNFMTCRDCVQLPLDADAVQTIIYTQMLRKFHNMLFHLVALDYRRNTDIGILKKERGDIFSECCIESFKEKFLRYVNEVPF